jgi:hypothetical protein
VTFAINARSLSYWDVNSSSWQITRGCYGVMVGHSSRDIAQRATLAVDGASCPGAAASVSIPGSGRGCPSRSSILIRLRRLRRSQVRRVTIVIDGHRQRALRGKRSSVRVAIPNRGPGRVVRVRLIVRTARGQTVVIKRRYRTCAAKPRHRPRRRVRKRH